jgi:uncharacterized protein (TIGR02246 family)
VSRPSSTVLFVLVAGLGIGYFARGAAGVPQAGTHAADVAAIEKLNQEDIDATLARDAKRLENLWADDAVAFFPGEPPAVGKPAIAAHNDKFRAQYPAMKVLSYTSTYKNLQVQGSVACEWFEKKGEFKLSPDSPAATWQANGLVVLKRQGDGSWKALMIFGDR